MDHLNFVGVELGGTKSIAVLAQGRQIVERLAIPTTTPDETLRGLRQAISTWRERQAVSAMGIASFGPVELNVAASNYGCMLDTPKRGWSGAPIVAALTRGFDGPSLLDTDVNGAALAEFKWGSEERSRSLCYITAGTGVGGGVVVNGQAVHGAMHPEIGHLRLRRAPGDVFAGACPFHGDCIEGLVSGPALARRFNGDPALVPDDDPRWALVAHDFAELIGAILLTISADHIAIGGGVVMHRPFLLPLIRERAVKNLASYLPFLTTASAEQLIGLPKLGADAGPLGAIALAMAAFANAQHR